ncbi:hypothetical protein DXA96_14600 [Lachnospiraceae bacterium OF09-33XD]|nr:hypothetical protein DXA96_14600 [Lachnospiraceae bacterium OF09-33XD]
MRTGVRGVWRSGKGPGGKKWDAFPERGRLCLASDTDGVHLTEEGHRKLGIAVADAVRKIFKREKDTGGEE